MTTYAEILDLEDAACATAIERTRAEREYRRSRSQIRLDRLAETTALNDAAIAALEAGRDAFHREAADAERAERRQALAAARAASPTML